MGFIVFCAAVVFAIVATAANLTKHESVNPLCPLCDDETTKPGHFCPKCRDRINRHYCRRHSLVHPGPICPKCAVDCGQPFSKRQGGTEA